MIDEDAPVIARAEIVIAAAPSAVWAVLTDIARWPDWFPRITAASIDGPVAVGSVIHWRTGAMTIASRLTMVEDARRLDWDGMSDGTRGLHSWTLVAEGHGTRARNAESMSGGAADADAAKLQSVLDDMLARWNEHLKRRCEGDAAERA